MKKIYSFALILVLASVLSSAFVGVVSKSKVSAYDGENHQQVAATTQTAQPAGASYQYVAQPGDSYSQMARKATQTHGIKNKSKLSRADIIFVETNLTQLAGSPVLNLGQKVGIAEATVKQWVDKAATLTPAQEQAWNFYVPFANFNTNNVGVAK